MSILAKDIGMKDGNMLIADIGDTIEITSKTIRRGEQFQAGTRYIDGLSIDDTESVVRDRKHLAEDGLIVAVCCMSKDSGELLQDPDLINRGSILTDAQVAEAKKIIARVFTDYDIKASDLGDVRNTIRKQLKNYVLKKTKKSPMIIPVITEV